MDFCEEGGEQEVLGVVTGNLGLLLLVYGAVDQGLAMHRPCSIDISILLNKRAYSKEKSGTFVRRERSKKFSVL